ncbi:Translationally-controlled tumor protein [Heterocephalus glaber]|uniref:Translationally-controlled tumor protein n=1 Tax=Heterocephalus glaber TaxID=10181 RepID=G5BLD4_HETGA|nr:Translationally-controlled tumor protein [Heterocephalus glaber]
MVEDVSSQQKQLDEISGDVPAGNIQSPGEMRRDLISQDEMFSDIYNIWEITGGLCLEVEGKMISRAEGNTDDSFIGENPSAEGPEGKDTESTVVTGVDIVVNHHLQETCFTKEDYKKYLKDCLKSKTNLENKDQKE